MKPSAVEAYKAVRAAHDQVVKSLVQLENDVQERCGNDVKELADIAYALREITELGDDIRKRSAALGRTAQSAACLLQITINSTANSISTEYCCASLNLKTVVSIPKRSNDPENFAKLMDYLKVPRELWAEGEHAAMQPHWPGLVELISNHMQQGKPLPPGVDPNKTFPDYSLRIRSRKDVAA